VKVGIVPNYIANKWQVNNLKNKSNFV
jgi:hypothetical protein